MNSNPVTEILHIFTDTRDAAFDKWWDIVDEHGKCRGVEPRLANCRAVLGVTRLHRGAHPDRKPQVIRDHEGVPGVKIYWCEYTGRHLLQK